MAQTSGFDPTLKVKTCFDCKMFDVANWIARLNGEDGPGGTPSQQGPSTSQSWPYLKNGSEKIRWISPFPL